MNKKRKILGSATVLLLIGLTVLMAMTACSDPAGNADPSTQSTTTQPTESQEILIPGVADNDLDADGFVDETMVPTTSSTQEGSNQQQENDPTTEPSKETEPETTEESEEPEATRPTDEQPTPPDSEAAMFEAFMAMNGEEQEAFAETFTKLEDFVKWYNRAKEAYEKLHPDVEIEDGIIDIGG